MIASSALLAVTTRSGHIESEHYGHVVAVDARGQVLFAFGDPDTPTYMRSSAKPFQAITTLNLGCADRFGWGTEEIAVVCASHSADDEHLVAVRTILAKAGLSGANLGCGPHTPLSHTTRSALERSGRKASRIHNNCSGKHAGMLAACVTADWPIDSYLQASHPLQQANLATLARFAEVDPATIETGVDGCGVPSFYLPLRSMATSFARLAKSLAYSQEDRQSAERVFEAMSAHPSLIAGKGRFNTQLSEFLGKRGVAKGGAEGIFCVGLAEPNVGIVVKITDGSARSHPIVLANALQQLLPEMNWNGFQELTNPALKNTRGEKVGQIISAI